MESSVSGLQVVCIAQLQELNRSSSEFLAAYAEKHGWPSNKQTELAVLRVQNIRGRAVNLSRHSTAWRSSQIRLSDLEAGAVTRGEDTMNSIPPRRMHNSVMVAIMDVAFVACTFRRFQESPERDLVLQRADSSRVSLEELGRELHSYIAHVIKSGPL